MIDKTIARRYAQALFDIAEERNSHQELLVQWRFVVSAIYDNAEVNSVILGHLTSLQDKKKAAQAIFKGQVDSLLLNLLFVLLDKSREEYIKDVLLCYEQLLEEKEGLIDVQLTSAAALTEEQEAALSSALAQKTGKKIKIHTKVDTDLIGGMVMKIGDTIYDGSLIRQLSLLQQQLVR